VADAHIVLIQHDAVVAETTCGADGKFTFSGVEPGAYDFVAAGPTAFAAVGFEAVAGVQEPAAQEPAAQEPAADQAGEPEALDEPVQERFDVAVTPAADAPVMLDQVDFASDACGGEIVTADSSILSGSPIEMCGDAIGCGACAGSCGCGWDTGYYGGGGGYGGFGGMFGGLADLAQLAIAGWVITELIDEIDFNDNNNPNLPPVSPNN
jgi:hypothetical protein